MDEEAARTAADYLRARRLSAPARLVVREVVLRGNPAERLRDFARAGGVDLIVMTAHGHAGTRRSALGSVTDRLARQGLPLFIVRPLTADTDQGHAVWQEQLEPERPSVAGLTEAE
jgi:nucleotide-binding universal stress UspA family protein